MTAADGVHLGQDDLPPAEARRILGPEAIIGLSTHSVDQVVKAMEQGVDYLAIGPIFPTVTKSNPDPVIGLKGLREVRKAVGDRQLIAIGGISADDLEAVFAAGANSVAMIGGLFQYGDVTSRFRELTGIADRHNIVRHS